MNECNELEHEIRGGGNHDRPVENVGHRHMPGAIRGTASLLVATVTGQA